MDDWHNEIDLRAIFIFLEDKILFWKMFSYQVDQTQTIDNIFNIKYVLRAKIKKNKEQPEVCANLLIEIPLVCFLWENTLELKHLLHLGCKAKML